LISVSCFVDKLDRRTWTKISSVGVFCCYMTMGISEYISNSIEPRPTLWLPLICSWVAAIFSSVGLYSMPWILLGELFPTSTKDFMGGLQMTIICILQFLAVKTYPLLDCMLHIYNLCLIFSVGGFLSYIYSKFFMPETRGKTLAEIERGWIWHRTGYLVPFTWRQARDQVVTIQALGETLWSPIWDWVWGQTELGTYLFGK